MRNPFRRTIAPRRRLSPAEEIELAQLKLAKRGGPEPDYFPARAAYLEATTGFRPGLLHTLRRELEGMPVPQLISEITHAKAQLREQRRVPPWEPYGGDENRDAIDRWQAHLGALKAEFDRLRGLSWQLPELDRLRLEVAGIGVHSTGNEWPAFHTVRSMPEPDPGSRETVRVLVPVSALEPAAAKEAGELQQRVFRLYDQANCPVVWTEDGPEYDDTDYDADDPVLAESITEAEKALTEFLLAHRDELGDHPAWQPHYQGLDRYSSEVAWAQAHEGEDTTEQIEEDIR